MTQNPIPPVPVWIYNDAPDPDDYTLNLQLDLVQAFIVLDALCKGAEQMDVRGNREMSKVIFQMAEAMHEKYQLIGGGEAGLALLRKRKGMQ